MARSSSEISRIIRARLKVLDPDISAEVGTPERKIIDTVAETIAEAEIDQFVLNYQYDIDTKVGDDLDRFVALFGFARQGGRQATGTVTFLRTAQPTTETAAQTDVIIPIGTQVVRPATSVSPAVVYLTTATVTLYAGALEVDAPVQALDPGESGNAPANSIISFGSADSFGISEVTNAVATSGGTDAESDAELRVRFKNTVFRNISGTKDQFLALATASRFTKKANVIGPMSRFSEYIQVESDLTSATQLGAQGFAKYIYAFDYFLSNGDPGNEIFYTPSSDFTLSISNPGGGSPATSNLTAVVANTTSTTNFIIGTSGTLDLTNAAAFGTSGTVKLGNSYPPVYVTYTGKAGNQLTGTVATGTGTVLSGAQVTQGSLDVGQNYLLEQTYTSLSSRNDPANNIMMYVDIFVSGSDDQNATEQLAFPPTGNAVVNTPTTSRYYNAKFNRDGTTTLPTLGNWLLFPANQPIVSLPTSITIGANTWVLGTHYWLVKDITTNGGSRRAQDAIEWSSAVTTVAGTQFLMTYVWNRVPMAVNEIVDTYKGVTQDVLVHAARLRYFNVNLVVMYQPGFSPASVEAAIFDALQDFMERQNFGALIQMADLVGAVSAVSGVDAVRIARSSSPVDDAVRYGVQEVNKAGNTILNTFTQDFGLLDSQLPVLNLVNIYRRAQNTWQF